MYDSELTTIIQQERERAIREARLHHRADLPLTPSKLQRLRAAASSLVRAVARRQAPDPGATPIAAGESGLSGSSRAAQGSGSSVASS